MISGRYGLENRLLVGVTHLCRRSIQKKRLSVHLYIHISVVGNIISSATLEDLIADLDEDDEFVEIIKNLNINDTYTSEEASGEVISEYHMRIKSHYIARINAFLPNSI